MKFIKEFFATRKVGFYVTIVALILSIIQVSIYSSAFSAIEFAKYYHWTVVLFSSLGIVFCIGLSCTKFTERFAPLVLFAFELTSFAMFIEYGYMYFTELFFSGFKWSLVGEMYYGYLGSIICYVLIFGLSIASSFMLQGKKINKEEANHEN